MDALELSPGVGRFGAGAEPSRPTALDEAHAFSARLARASAIRPRPDGVNASERRYPLVGLASVKRFITSSGR